MLRVLLGHASTAKHPHHLRKEPRHPPPSIPRRLRLIARSRVIKERVRRIRIDSQLVVNPGGLDRGFERR
jgi:hypothetical protein